MHKLNELDGVQKIEKKDIQAEKTFVDASTGEVHQLVQIKKKQVVSYKDSLNFTKIYPKGLFVLSTLSISSTKLLSYILDRCLKKNSSVFSLSLVPAMQHCGWNSKSCFHKSMKELEEKHVCKLIEGNSVLGTYQINPNMFFNGNRLKAVSLDEQES